MDKVGEGRRGKRSLLANGDGVHTMVVPMKDKGWRTTHGKERGGNGKTAANGGGGGGD